MTIDLEISQLPLSMKSDLLGDLITPVSFTLLNFLSSSSMLDEHVVDIEIVKFHLAVTTIQSLSLL